jgi:pyridoxamine 5'-phosphate oxidase
MADLRRERIDYESDPLLEAEVPSDPLVLFGEWLDDALAAKDQGLLEPTAMTVSTVARVGDEWQPQARVVLLKEFDERGFVFFTNYESAKGHEIAANPRVCASFFWMPLSRQVRIDGVAERISAEESDDYFSIRPRGAQVGAWASRQSTEVANLGELETAYEEADLRFPDDPVPRPPHWGGYVIAPTRIEFWVGRRSRMHDRLVYTRNETRWAVGRLAP